MARAGYTKVSTEPGEAPLQEIPTICVVISRSKPVQVVLFAAVVVAVAVAGLVFALVDIRQTPSKPWVGEFECDSPSEYSICKWTTLFGSPPSVVQVPISGNNPLWANGDNPVLSAQLSDRFHQQLTKELTLACSEGRGAADIMCKLFDSVVLSIGVNGIIDVISRGFMPNEENRNASLNNAVFEAWDDLDHLVGTWAMLQSLRRLHNPRPAIEVTGSFMLGGAPLHGNPNPNPNPEPKP